MNAAIVFIVQEPEMFLHCSVCYLWWALVVLFHYIFDFYYFGEASGVCNQISILCGLFGGHHSTHLSERRTCIYMHTSCLRLNELL